MPITQAIILAGGMGTRLRSVLPDLPKCMAPVAGKPFVDYVINYCLDQGIRSFIFSLGYRHEIITNHLEANFPSLKYEVVIEDEPLGTGGAIQLAMTKAGPGPVAVLNGDTLYLGDLQRAATFHIDKKADCTLILKPMKQFERYGVVEIDEQGKIIGFREKQYYDEGLINGGIYILNPVSFLSEALSSRFSFEKDYLEQLYSFRNFAGIVQDQYFIDIGIPEDYERAQTELAVL
jgi:D-glycero-alpha-D-manno-heptose 1-phosphate guanylyltransferase